MEGLDSNARPHAQQSQATPVVASPSSPTATLTSNQMPFQPRPQPRVPQRQSLTSRRLLPPPSHTLTSWEKDFLTRNKDNVYELLLVSADMVLSRL